VKIEMGLFALAALLNITAVTECQREDLEFFAKEINACSQDRFGANCNYRYTKSLEFLPAFRDRIIQNQNAEAVWRRRQCSSAWFHAWLCSLPPEPRDLTGITVGKTILQRVVRSYDATLNRRRTPKRPTFNGTTLDPNGNRAFFLIIMAFCESSCTTKLRI